MDENLRSRTPKGGGGGEDQIETISVITEVNSTDLVNEEEIAPTTTTTTTTKTPYMAESMSTEWTEKKHRLFLSSMEASFVKQLYSSQESHRSMNMLDWSSRGRSKPDPNNSLRQLNASERGPSSSSGQFKVIQSGHWKQLNFDKPQPRLAVVVNESPPALPKSHWIEHYRPGRRHREVTSTKMEENGSSPCDDVLDEAAVHLGGNKTTTTTSSKGFSQLYHQESVGNSTEVSDQNFPIEDHEGEQLSSFSGAKRMKTTTVDDSTGVDDSNKDQVVPTEESPVMVVPPI